MNKSRGKENSTKKKSTKRNSQKNKPNNFIKCKSRKKSKPTQENSPK